MSQVPPDILERLDGAPPDVLRAHVAAHGGPTDVDDAALASLAASPAALGLALMGCSRPPPPRVEIPIRAVQLEGCAITPEDHLRGARQIWLDQANIGITWSAVERVGEAQTRALLGVPAPRDLRTVDPTYQEDAGLQEQGSYSPQETALNAAFWHPNATVVFTPGPHMDAHTNLGYRQILISREKVVWRGGVTGGPAATDTGHTLAHELGHLFDGRSRGSHRPRSEANLMNPEGDENIIDDEQRNRSRATVADWLRNPRTRAR